MHVRHAVEKRVTKFNESRFLSLVNGSMMIGIERSKNVSVRRKKMLAINLKKCWDIQVAIFGRSLETLGYLLRTLPVCPPLI